MTIIDKKIIPERCQFKELNIGEVFVYANDYLDYKNNLKLKIEERTFWDGRDDPERYKVLDLNTCTIEYVNPCDAIIPIKSTLTIEAY